MAWTAVEDWDDAYNNRGHTPGWDAFPPRWETDAAAFRAQMSAAGRAHLDIAYGSAPRERYDLFQPEGEAHGLVVFVHGGYWRSFAKSDWSHFGAGALGWGWAVAMPSYTLAPEARIGQISRQAMAGIAHAAGETPGPIRLMGHSAGGHLVARAIAEDTDLPAEVLARIEHVMPISGLGDLRPLLRLEANEIFRLDPAEAQAESPIFHAPVPHSRVTAWVGGDERPEFLRQSQLIANAWTGMGATTRFVSDPGKNHFTVIDGLMAPDSPITAALFD